VSTRLPPSVAEPPEDSHAREAGRSSTPLVRARRLSKIYGVRRGLRALDLLVEPGERIGVVGANGAGKSTLIKLLALLLRPTSGSLEIAGADCARAPQAIKKLLGVAFHDSLLYPDLTVAENVRFTARLYAVDHGAERTARLLQQFGIAPLADVRVRALSRGQRQRASLARALVNDPRIVLLDEPDTGLDARSVELLAARLSQSNAEAVVFTTHQPAHAIELATRLLLLEDGRARDLGSARQWTPASLSHLLLAASSNGGLFR
jgi:heme exporter protein A